MAPALCPAAGGLRYRAVLLLAVCLSVTALPHGLGSLVAPLPGHLSQRGHGDPRNHPTMEPPASEGTSGCSCGEGNSNHGMGAAGLALGTPTGAVMLGDSSVPTSDLTTSSGFSDIQREAPGAPARSPEGQEQAVSPCHPASGVGEDPAAAHLQPPAGPSLALPSEETSSWAGARPGTAPVPSVPAVTPVGHWSLGTVSVFPPSAMSPGVSHPQVMVPSEGLRGPAVTSEEQIDPSPPPSKAHPVPMWMWVPSSSGSAEAGVSSAAPGATKAPHEDGAATGASWSPEPMLGSVPPPSSSTLAPRHPPSATRSPSPSQSHPLASPAPSSWTPAVTPDAHPMSSPSPVTSWHPSDVPTATSWVAAGGTLTAEATSRSDPGSVGAQPPVHTLPLSFRLLGIAYTEALSRKASGSYRQLEDEVRLMVSASRAPRGGLWVGSPGHAGCGVWELPIPVLLFQLGQALSSYETYLQANVLEFRWVQGAQVGLPQWERSPPVVLLAPSCGSAPAPPLPPPGMARCWCVGRFCSGGMPPAAPTSSARCSQRRAEQGTPSAGGWSPAPSPLEVSQEGLQRGGRLQTSPCALIQAQTSLAWPHLTSVLLIHAKLCGAKGAGDPRDPVLVPKLLGVPLVSPP